LTRVRGAASVKQTDQRTPQRSCNYRANMTRLQGDNVAHRRLVTTNDHITQHNTTRMWWHWACSWHSSVIAKPAWHGEWRTCLSGNEIVEIRTIGGGEWRSIIKWIKCLFISD